MHRPRREKRCERGAKSGDQVQVMQIIAPLLPNPLLKIEMDRGTSAATNARKSTILSNRILKRNYLDNCYVANYILQEISPRAREQIEKMDSGALTKSWQRTQHSFQGASRKVICTRIIRYKGHPIRDIIYLSEKLRDMTL